MKESTGMDSLNRIIDGLRTGDNVVWQVDTMDDYAFFAAFFVKAAISEGKRVIYMRFAGHPPLLDDTNGVTIYPLDAEAGFEVFSTQVHTIVNREGEGVCYVFDCLSDLLSAWATDLMVGNFFKITCPHLFRLNTIAYFALLRNSHSFKTVARIRETTQVLLDVFSAGGSLFVHPLKVKGRHSHTMFLPHKKHGNDFVPLVSSVDAAKLLTYISAKGKEHAKRNLDYWDRLFLDVEELIGKDGADVEKERILGHLCGIMIAREKRMVELAKANLTLEDLLAIKERLIGTGYIGGKSAGMLIARKILSRDPSFDWSRHLEPHDSFFIGSDVFYTYIVENGWWQLHMQQRTKEGYFEVAGTLREQMLAGSFPEEVEEQFWQIIEYFGQSPIIVRSSSLLEDAFGNAFAGKYESIFCVNQGTPEQRFAQFRDSIRQVFASAMNEDALAYRLQRGADLQDEQMALLVQRVSGSQRQNYFFPDLAGVGVSYNAFVWKSGMDPRAGMLRLVLGLGTKAVNRSGTDYPRIVALDAPLVRPHAGMEDAARYSQHEVELLSLERNRLEACSLNELTTKDLDLDWDLLAVRDYEAIERFKQRGMKRNVWVLTLDEFLSRTGFAATMQRMLKRLETVYEYPVDTEFTVNLSHDGQFQINLVQCRPLQTKGEGQRVRIPEDIKARDIFFRALGSFMGCNMTQQIKRIVYVDAGHYSGLTLSQKHDVARLIGKLNRQIEDRDNLPTLLMGPGRWGSTTPSLGVPVRFSDINHMAVLVEVEARTGSLTPDLSFGTHFFQDLVEADIFYVAIFPGRPGVIFNEEWLQGRDNYTGSLMADFANYESVVKVYNVTETNTYLMADIISQRVVCFSGSKTDQ
jgi:hypothetical protein